MDVREFKKISMILDLEHVETALVSYLISKPIFKKSENTLGVSNLGPSGLWNEISKPEWIRSTSEIINT